MNRRYFLATPLILSGCGGDMAEYTIAQSPLLRTSKNVFGSGVSGLWTPSITFTTPGNLSVAYQARSGFYFRLGEMVYAAFYLLTGTFTHTTASGNFRVSGFPFVVGAVSASGLPQYTGFLEFSGITLANYTQFGIQMENGDTSCFISACGSAQSQTVLGEGEVPSGGQIYLQGSVWYKAQTLT